MTCSISFAGCGFLMSYHIGVAMCLRQYAPELVMEKICSTSSGLLVAVSLICDIPLGVITTEILRIANLARSFTLGPLDPRFNLQKCLEEVLRNHLPSDAHERATGRLFISVTRIHDKSNVILSEFRYREQLIQAILAGCFIPTYSGIIPVPFKGVRYIDGSVTNNQPVVDQHTIRVSPFSGEADICPRSTPASSHANLVSMVVDVTEENLGRFFRVFIPQDPAAMIRLCQQGFDDALGYLHCNKKTVLAKSFFITSTFLVIEKDASASSLTAQEEAEGNNNNNKKKMNNNNITSSTVGQWGRALWDGQNGGGGDEEDRIDSPSSSSSALSRSESVLKTLNINGVSGGGINNKLDNSTSGGDVKAQQEEAEEGDDNKEGRTVLIPVDLIVANLKSISYNAIETRAFQMRLPKYVDSNPTAVPYFKRYLLRPVTQMLSEKICSASRVVLERVNRRVNVEALTDLLRKRQEHSSAPEDIKLLKHILQMTNEQIPFQTVYFIEESSNKIHVTELFDISDCEDSNLQTETERELNQMLEFDIDDWGDADFGANDDDGDVWGEVGADEELFPPEPGQGSLNQTREEQEEEEKEVRGVDKIKEDEAQEDEDDDPYIFGNMASKALNMSQEYTEMIFGTFRHLEADFNDVEAEDAVEGDRTRNASSGVAAGELSVADKEEEVEVEHLTYYQLEQKNKRHEN